MIQKWAMALAVLAGLAFSAPAQANILLVGATNVPPDVFATNPVTDLGNTVLASQTVSGSASTLDISVHEWVVRLPSGTLDFVYQVDNHAASSDGMGRFTVSNFGTGPLGSFGPFILDTGYVAGTGTVGLNTQPIPDTVDRLNSAHGNVVGWNFPLLGVAPGASSAVLVVATDATRYTTGKVAAIDGSSVNLAGYQPIAVPEPSSMVLVGLGVLGLTGYGLRRRKARTA